MQGGSLPGTPIDSSPVLGRSLANTSPVKIERKDSRLALRKAWLHQYKSLTESEDEKWKEDVAAKSNAGLLSLHDVDPYP